jgi:hypothetical protein
MVDLASRAAELSARGFCVLEGLLEPDHLDAASAEMLRLLDACRRRDRATLRTCAVPAGCSPGDKLSVPASPGQLGQGATPGQMVQVYVPQGTRPGDQLDVPVGGDWERGEIAAEGRGGLQETERYTSARPRVLVPKARQPGTPAR